MQMFFSSMYILVTYKITFECKAFATLVTFKWPLTSLCLLAKNKTVHFTDHIQMAFLDISVCRPCCGNCTFSYFVTTHMTIKMRLLDILYDF